MVDIRKIGIIFVIAVIFTGFVFTLIEAIYPSPKYDDFCSRNRFVEPRAVKLVTDDTCETKVVASSDEIDSCTSKKGDIRYSYDSDGCATSYECDTCNESYDVAREMHGFVVFIISAIFGIIAIILGMNLPAKKKGLNEWIGTGFMLGGLITLFVATVMYIGDMHRIVRPIILFVELVVVIYVAYKKIK